jgi:hypothetical protein
MVEDNGACLLLVICSTVIPKLYVGFLVIDSMLALSAFGFLALVLNTNFNLFGDPVVRHQPMSGGTAIAANVAKLPELLRNAR